MDDLTQEFLAESQEGLDRMEQCLTTLETRADDPELVAEIFRAVHTIKGTTGFLGFKRLETLAHAGENLLGALRDGRVKVSGELITGLLELLDGLRRILVLIETTGKEGTRTSDEDAGLVEMLQGLMPVAGPETARVPEKPVGGYGGGYGGLLPSKPARGAEGGAQEYVSAGPAAKSSAAPDGIAANSPAQTSGCAGDEGAVYAGENGGASDKTLRVDVEVLNRMMNLVGELVLTRNQILQTGLQAEQFAQLGRRLDAVTADLRETVMQARMQPVGHVFSKFPRMIRDLAKLCGKTVRVEFSGQETGLDKSLLAAIKDPLTHAVRNAVDHGIESPVARLKAGKLPEGVVRLRAFHQGGSVVIEVADDGAGIGVGRVRAKAIERGLVTMDRGLALTEREAMQMVFLPGFSTAAEVTHVSGRGVGMDVVRANVEKVGGSVELESTEGKGTLLRLKVPLTLAIVPALVVVSAGESFAIPQNTLVELVYVPRGEAAKEVERMGTVELYRLRDRLLPLVRLDRLLRLDGPMRMEMEPFYLAVLEAEKCSFGLVVDDLLAPEEIVVKPLSGVLREIGVFSGASVLGNGRLAFILDIPALAQRAGVTSMDLPKQPNVELAAIKQEARRFLVFEGGVQDRGDGGGTGKAERMAMPLEEVERIESVGMGSIEYAGGLPHLQYRGVTLPLEDAGGLLRGGEGRDPERAVTVLICTRANARGVDVQRAAIVVREVSHVAEGTLLASRAGITASRKMAIVDGLVTAVHENDGMAWMPGPTMGPTAGTTFLGGAA